MARSLVRFSQMSAQRSGRSLVLALLCLGGWGSASAAILEQTAPAPTTYLLGTDYSIMNNTALGDVTAPVQAVDIQLGLGNLSTSGCEAADFAGFAAGYIALLQRGVCTFEMKAENAAAAGAVGVLIFNQGNTAGNTGLLFGNLTLAYTGGLPVMGLTYALGAEFAATPGLTIHMQIARADIPEPGSLALLGIGIAGIASVSRRLRKS